MKENEDFEKDPLWEVLGKARAVTVSPFFARNVVRAVRLQEAANVGASFGFRDFLELFRSWRPAAAAVIVAGIMLSLFAVMTASEDGRLLAFDFNQDLDREVIVNLNELLAMEETSLWLESSPY